MENINIISVQEHLETLSNLSDKINYLINVKSEYEINDLNNPISQHFKNWFKDHDFKSDSEIFPKQCDALISKYESLLKYSVPPETKEPTETEIKKEFTASKIKVKFNPELVFKEFKEFLKCDIDTFKDWFVDGKVSDKKMSWKYDNQNKTQLRCFLFELCGGWSPKDTNKAFKILVDSNTRQTNLNDDLLKKINKCKI